MNGVKEIRKRVVVSRRLRRGCPKFKNDLIDRSRRRHALVTNCPQLQKLCAGYVLIAIPRGPRKGPSTIQAVDTLFGKIHWLRTTLYAEPVPRARCRTVGPEIRTYRSSVVCGGGRAIADHPTGSGRADRPPPFDRTSSPVRPMAVHPVHATRRPTIRPAQSHLPGPSCTSTNADRRFATVLRRVREPLRVRD